MDNLHTQLAQALNIQNFSAEDQAEIFAQLGENILKQMIIDVSDKVPQAERERFRQLIKAGSFEDVVAFLEPIVTDLDFVIKEASQKTISEFKAVVG